MDPEKLERIQLPVPSAAEKTAYNHLLAERLIRIMNSAAQPGAQDPCWLRLGAVESQGPGPTPGTRVGLLDLALLGVQADLSHLPCHTLESWATTASCPAVASSLGPPPPAPVVFVSDPLFLLGPFFGLASGCSSPPGWPTATFEHELG